jgi:hypothetical protein
MSTETAEGFAEWRGGIEARVTTLEVTGKQETWARAKMDEDMSDLKIQFGKQDFMLKALSKTQSEHTATLRDHTATLRDHTARLIRLETGMARLETGMARLESGMTTVNAGIQTIIDLVTKADDGGEPEAGSETDGGLA